MFAVKLANFSIFPVSEEITDIFGNGRTSSLVFGNLRQSSGIVVSLMKSSEIIRNLRKIILAFLEPFLLLSGKNVLFHVTKPKNKVFSVIEFPPFRPS